MRKVNLFKTYVSFKSIWNVCLLLIKSNYGATIGEGPQVKAFENEFGEKFGFKNVVALNSGTAALEIAYDIVGVNEGDEVICPVLTHPSSTLPAARKGAKVIFADIEDDLNVSIDDIRSKITPKTKVVVFVHFGGNNRGLKELIEICKEKNIILIEDAAQAVGTDSWGKADFTCVSLQAVKTLTSVDGGFLICKSEEDYLRAKKLRWFGYDRELKQKVGDTDITEAGYKYHMNDVIACIGRGNLDNADWLLSHRKKLISEYRKNGVNAHMWFGYTLTKKRDELINRLKQNGISSGTHHYRNDKYSVFGGKQNLPNMDRIEKEFLLLPLHHGVKVSDVQNICKIINSFK
jgi:dTDP-4-amino-4,6-dideoxygalactose transaminase